MVNPNVSILTSNYNLSTLIDASTLIEPVSFLAVWNSEITFGRGWAMIALLMLLGLVIYLADKRFFPNISDSEASVHAGVIISIAGTMLFLIETSIGLKLVSFVQLVPLYAMTGIAILVNNTNKKW